MQQRYETLDSLRGLASLTVLIHHFLLVAPLILWLNNLEKTPIHIFWSGHSAVILFFVLSGFVLALPFISGKRITYSSFIIRRISRIYIPYLFSILFSIVAMYLFSKNGIPELSSWFNEKWITTLDWKLFINHLLFIGDYQHNLFNPIYWTLIHELRISFIFPFLMWIIIKYNWKANLLLGFLLSCFTLLVKYLAINQLGYTDYAVGLFETPHYVTFFIFGALIAKHVYDLKNLYLKLNLVHKLLLFLFAILTYTYSWWFLPGFSVLHIWIWDNLVISLGVVIFFIFSLFSIKVSKLLLTKPILFLGEISFSIYLLHSVVLLSSLYILFGQLNIILIWIIAFVTTLLLSTLCYYYVEKPSVKLGKFLSNKIKKRNPSIKLKQNAHP